MPATSKKQQIAMAIAEHEPGKLYAQNKGMLKMSHSQLHDFAATKRKGLPYQAKKYQMGGMVDEAETTHNMSEDLAEHPNMKPHERKHMKHVHQQLKKCGIC